MRHKKCALLAPILAVLLLVGCAAVTAEQTKYVNPMNFYYLSREGGHDAQSGALAYQTVDLLRSDRTVEDVVEEYLQGPDSWSLRSPFPAGTTCEGIWMDADVLCLRMSEEYAQLSGIYLTLANACLTMTMQQLDFVNGVRIVTDETTLSEQNRTALAMSDFVLSDKAADYPSRKAEIYFADRQSGLLRAEQRLISTEDGRSFAELALEQLLNGAVSDKLESRIPSGTKCVDLRLDSGVCTVVLSDDFARCDTDAESAELAVRCIVATLCAQEGVDRVALSLLNGEDLTYFSLQQVLRPENSWYAQ